MMKICAAIDDPNEIPLTANADLVEIELNLFESMSEKIDKPLILKVNERKRILTWKDPIDAGYINIGEYDPPFKTDLKTISAVHNSVNALSSDEIVEKLNSFEGDIVQGVFKMIRPGDLVALYDASKSIKKPHILLGMGEMGIITRLRPRVLGNEFTYSHVGPKEYPGQLSAEDMRENDDDCTILGLLSHPIRHSLNKSIITKAMADMGIKGYYLNFDVPTIEHIDEVIRRYDITGLNIGLPFKKDIMAYTDSLDKDAKSTGIVNLIHNTGSKIIGSNTDVYGIDYALSRSDTAIEGGMKVLVIGSGGVARSAVSYMMEKGADVTSAGMNQIVTDRISKQFGCSKIKNDDPSGYDIIISCIQSNDSIQDNYPIDLTKITQNQTIFDISVGSDTQLRAMGRNKQCREIPGMEVFIGQGMRSFEIWTGKIPDHDSLMRSMYSG